MLLGIQKRQWVLLILVLLLPLLLNAVEIWLEIGTDRTLQLLNGTYQPSNPNLPPASLLEILAAFLRIIAPLGLLSWFVIFMSNRVFFQRQWLIFKISETLLAALLIAIVFEIVTGVVMPLAWLPQFHDYLLGLPSLGPAVNGFEWTRWLVLPATATILFIAMLLSVTRKIATPSIPS
jgi:hypothetical protein